MLFLILCLELKTIQKNLQKKNTNFQFIENINIFIDIKFGVHETIKSMTETKKSREFYSICPKNDDDDRLGFEVSKAVDAILLKPEIQLETIGIQQKSRFNSIEALELVERYRRHRHRRS